MKRRICSLLLVLAMLMNMVCVAWAGEVVSEQSTDTGTVTQTIYEVNVLIDELVIGEPLPQATVPEGAPYYVAQTQWTDLRTNEPVTELVDGTVYWVQIDVLPLVGYLFDGDVELLINGTDDWDYASHGDSYVSSYASICKEYSFCETIDEVNITLPEAVPGQAVPVPTVDPDAPYELTEWTWWDAITYEEVETLEDGGVYYFEPMLQVKKGYTFVEDVHLYINGEPIGKFWGDRFSFDPWCEFSFAEKIYEVNVLIDEPVIGEPLPMPAVPEGAPYEILEAYWNDIENYETVTVAENGKKYQLDKNNGNNNLHSGLDFFKNRIWQVLEQEPVVVCDTGHNEDGIRYVAEQLANLECDRLFAVMGFAREKELSKILALLPVKAHYIFTRANIERARAIEDIAAEATALGLDFETAPSVKEAVERARCLAAPTDAIFIGGSNYVIAEL